jgi:hypothetical protein
MKAEYVDDPYRGPGYARLLIGGIDVTAGAATPRCVIKRSSDGKTLGRGGWDQAEHDMPCRGMQPLDDGIALSVGPEVVDNLDELEGYRLLLRCADGGESVCSLRLAGITYSPQAGVSGVAEIPEAPPRQARVDAVEAGEESGKAGAVSAGQADDDDIITLDDVVPRGEPEEAPPYEGIPPLSAPPAGGRNRTPVIAALALLLVVVGGMLVLKMQSGATENGKPSVRLPLTDRAAAGPEAGEGRAPDAPAPDRSDGAGRIAATSPLSRARGQLAGRADPNASLELYRRLRTEENGADAAFLLVEDAAQKGLPEAMLLVAGYYDPLVGGDNGSVGKDAEEAFTWYAKAEQAGIAEAATRLAALKERLAAEAAGGNREAERLLKRFSR